MVPMNIDFTVHRWAEWTMLMLGEAVFSLLVEEALDVDGYYITFYCGLATVIFLMYSHFASQPMEAEKHVMTKSKNRAVIGQNVQVIYALALVGMGAAFTLFVKSFADKGDYGGRRWLGEFMDEVVIYQRYLAGGGESNYSQYELKERAAHMFSISLGMVLFSIDFMSLLHLGSEELFKVCKSKPVMYLLVLMRFVIVAFVLSISSIIDDPKVLAPVGLGCTLLHNLFIASCEGILSKHE